MLNHVDLGRRPSDGGESPKAEAPEVYLASTEIENGC